MRRHVGHCICCLSVEDAAHTRCVDRVVQLARDYAARRTAFGKLLKDHGLHMQTLARMEVTRCATIWALLPVTYGLLVRWRLVGRSSWSWMYVACWVEKKAAQLPSLIRTCCVSWLLWSSCTLASRWAGQNRKEAGTVWNAAVIAPEDEMINLCTNIWKHREKALVSSQTPVCVSGSGCGFRGFGMFWWAGLHRRHWFARITSWCTGEEILSVSSREMLRLFSVFLS